MHGKSRVHGDACCIIFWYIHQERRSAIALHWLVFTYSLGGNAAFFLKFFKSNLFIVQRRRCAALKMCCTEDVCKCNAMHSRLLFIQAFCDRFMFCLANHCCHFSTIFSTILYRYIFIYYIYIHILLGCVNLHLSATNFYHQQHNFSYPPLQIIRKATLKHIVFYGIWAKITFPAAIILVF